MIVEIKGTGQKIEFPDGMSQEEMLQTLRRQWPSTSYTNALNMTTQGSVEPVEQTLEDKIKQGVADFLFNQGIISDRYGAQRIGENIAMGAGALPVIGDLLGGDEMGRALRGGDAMGIGMGALAAVPVVGDAARMASSSVIRGLSPVKKKQFDFFYGKNKSLLSSNGKLKPEFSRSMSEFEDSINDVEYDNLVNKNWFDSVEIPLSESDKKRVISKVNRRTLFHGSPDPDIDNLQRMSNGGLFLSFDKEPARYYAGEGGKLYEQKVSVSNPFFVESTDITQDMESSGLLDEISSMGYDSIIPLDYGDIVILKDEAIKPPTKRQ